MDNFGKELLKLSTMSVNKVQKTELIELCVLNENERIVGIK